MATIKAMKAEAARKRAMADAIDETKYAEDLRAQAARADKRASELRKKAEDPMEAILGAIGVIVVIAIVIGVLGS